MTMGQGDVLIMILSAGWGVNRDTVGKGVQTQGCKFNK